MRLLLVDDDPEIVRLASFSLEKVGGFEVETAMTAEEAVSLAESTTLDGVLLDLFLGETDGLDLLLVFKSHPRLRDLPIVIFTAETDRSAVKKALSMGAAGVVAKPFDLVRLPDEVKSALGV